MWVEIVLFLVSLLLLLYWFVTKSFGKWKDLGIPYSKASFPFGSYNFLSGRHLDDMSAEDYMNFLNEKYFGWFLFGKPMLAVNDVNLLKQIQVKDFDHFVDKTGGAINSKMLAGGDLNKLWLLMLTSLTGDQWKSVRSVFTPIFTSGKMKGMLKFIKLVGDDLCEEMESKAKEGEEFELRDVFGKFSLDALASAAFGVDGESFKQKDSIFVKNAANFFKFNTLENIVLFLKFLPGVAQFCEFFKINTMKPRETRFFRDIVLQTIRTRRETNVKRNDLIDMMLECLKNDVQTEVENEPTDQYEADMKLTNKQKSKKNLDETTIIATLMVLLVAGYDTTGMTLSYLAYELSKNPEIQEKLQAEIDEAMEESDGELPDYNVIQNLPYLDMVVHETLRFHCPVGGNIRVVTQDYTIPDTDLVLRKDDMVSFSTRGLHFDPKHWTHPSEFYPEHFSKEEKAARNPYAFQAFGQGPRACIGMRFAPLEAKVATIAVLSRFSFKPGTKTKEPLVLEPETTLAWPKGGLWVCIEKRDNM